MLISIIVPIYNVEDYLSKCLDSILSQTYKNIEVILVNDGSTDRSLQIAEKYVLADKRVILISQKNAGLSAARNAGVDKAGGEYVVFVDSDDWLEADFISEFYEKIKIDLPDFACCHSQYDNISSGKHYIYGENYSFDKLSGELILQDAFLGKNIHTAVWGKIYKRNVLIENHISFEPGIINEDTLYTMLVSLYAKEVVFVDKVLYHSLERNGSISRSPKAQLFLDMDTAFLKIKQHLIESQRYEAVEHIYKARYVKSMLYNLLQTAQRSGYSQFKNLYDVCLKETYYLKYGSCVTLLSFRHRGMFLCSRNKCLFYSVVKLLNFCGFLQMH